jgi:hypothetical protein
VLGRLVGYPVRGRGREYFVLGHVTRKHKLAGFNLRTRPLSARRKLITVKNKTERDQRSSGPTEAKLTSSA